MAHTDRQRRRFCVGSLAGLVSGPMRGRGSWLTLEPHAAPPIGFADIEGRALRLENFVGRPLLVNLWASWCAPCVVELPALDRLQSDVGERRLAVIALSMDRRGQLAVLTTFRRLQVRGLGVYVDRTGSAADQLGVTGLPATVLLNAQGGLVARRSGAVAWDAPAERADLYRRLDL